MYYNEKNGILSIDGVQINTNGKSGFAVVKEALNAFGFNSAEEMVKAKAAGAYVSEELQTLLNIVANQLPLGRVNQSYVTKIIRQAGVNSYGKKLIVDDSGVTHIGAKASDLKRR